MLHQGGNAKALVFMALDIGEERGRSMKSRLCMRSVPNRLCDGSAPIDPSYLTSQRHQQNQRV